MSETRTRPERAAWAAIMLSCAGLIFSAGIWYGSGKNFNEKLVEIAQKVDILGGKIDNIPVDHAELERHDRDITGLQTGFSLLRDRVTILEAAVTHQGEDLASAIRASNAPIMPSRGR